MGEILALSAKGEKDEQCANPSWAEPREPSAAPEGVNSPASALSGQQPNKLCPQKTNHNHH